MHFSCAAGQRRLEQVGGVHRAARCGARADQGVDFVDEQDGVGRIGKFLQHRFQALLEIAAIFGAGQQRAHVERIDVRILEDFRHIVFDDAPRQAFGDGGLAHAGLADQQRVVLAAAAQGLDDALQLDFAPDQRVDLAGQRLCVQIQRVVFQRAAGVCCFLFGFGSLCGLVGRARSGLVDAVRDVVHHVQAGDGALVEEIHRMRILLAEQGDQDVGAGHFFLVGGLHMQDGALDDALEADRRLGVHFVVARQDRGMGSDEIGQRRAQFVDVGAAGAQHMRGGGVVQHGEQQVLHRDELVPFLASFDERQVQADFKFLRNHFIFPPFRIVADARAAWQMRLPVPPWFRRYPGDRCRIPQNLPYVL